MSTTQPIKDKFALENFKNYYLEQENYRNYALITIGLNTALRIGDILSLQWKHVYYFPGNCFRSHICVTEQKTGKENRIAINSSVEEALQLLRTHSDQPDISFLPDACIFTSAQHKGLPLSRYQAFRIIKKAATATCMEEHISCHSLRKTFGYYAWKQGVEPAVLMNIYNHSSYQITKRYLCIEQEDRDEVFLHIQF